METFVFVLSVLLWPLSIILIGLILLQGGAGDLSSAFGGGGQLDSALGVGAGRKMSRLTAWMGAAFLTIVTILAVHRSPDIGRYKNAAGAAPMPIGLPMEDAIPTAEKPAQMAPAPGADLPQVAPTEGVQPPVEPTVKPVQPADAKPAEPPAADPAPRPPSKLVPEKSDK